MSFRLLITAVSTATVLALSAPADCEVIRMGLKDAIAAALKNNGSLKGAAYMASAARQDLRIAGSTYLPSLYLEESFSYSNSPSRAFMMKLDQGRITGQDFEPSKLNSPSPSTDFRTSIFLEQHFFSPEHGPGREIALQAARRTESWYEKNREAVAFSVFQLFLEVQRAKARLKAAQHSIQDANESLRLAQVRREAGIGIRADELRGRTHLSLAEQNRITAANNLELAKKRLAIVMGIDGGRDVEPAEEIGQIVLAQGIRELGENIGSRHDIAEARAAAGLAEASANKAGSSWLPGIKGNAAYQFNDRSYPFGRDNQAWYLGMSLNWRIFDGFRRYAENEKAAALQNAAREQLDSVMKEASYQVHEAWLRRIETGKRLEVARHSLLDAEETVRLISRRFENSLSTMSELLDAQSVLNHSRANLADTEADYLLATGSVYRASGIFLKEMQK